MVDIDPQKPIAKIIQPRKVLKASSFLLNKGKYKKEYSQARKIKFQVWEREEKENESLIWKKWGQIKTRDMRGERRGS